MSLQNMWWNRGKADVGSAIVEHLHAIATTGTDAERRQNLAAYRCMFMDYDHASFGEDGLDFFRDGKTSNNVLQGMVESTHAQIVTSRPSAKIFSVGGDWDIQTRVRLMNRWLDGEWERQDCGELLDQCVQDGQIFGTGALKVSPRHGRPYVERVWTGDLFVDPREERYLGQKVRCLYQHAGMDREVLASMFAGKHERAISMASLKIDDSMFEFLNASAVSDLVSVVEAWRLPPSPDKPGLHVMAIDGATLVYEPWYLDMFPFVFYRWGIDPMRFWGQGMIERGVAGQSELNDHSQTIAESFSAMFPSWWFPKGSRISSEVMSDEIGRVYFYDEEQGGTPPTHLTPPAVSPDAFRYLATLEERMMRNQGVSAYAAQAMKPAGLNSGKAILAHQDLGNVRFASAGRRYEQACTDLAKLLIATADQIAESDGTEKLNVYGGSKVLEMIDFGKARLGKDTPYVVRVEPVSKLSKTLAGKLEELANMHALGLITDPQRMLKLLGEPDLDNDYDLQMASRDLVDRAIDRCLDGEEGVAAHPFMDTAYAVPRAIQELNLAEQQGAPEEILQLLRDFIGTCEAIEDKKAAANQPPPPPMAGNDAPPPPLAANDPGVANGPPMPVPEAGGMPGPGDLPPAG